MSLVEEFLDGENGFIPKVTNAKFDFVPFE
jgi:hypothetical protein